MNAGFREGKKLAGYFANILKQDEPLASLNEYGLEQSASWRQLLGLTGELKPTKSADPWVTAHRARLLPCLPATGSDLTALAQALNLDFGTK